MFNETVFGYEDKANKTVGDIVMNDYGEDKSEIEEIESRNDKEVEHQWPQWHRCPPVRYGIEEYVDTTKDHVNHVTYCHIIEPKTMEEALNSEHRSEWKEAWVFISHRKKNVGLHMLELQSGINWVCN